MPVTERVYSDSMLPQHALPYTPGPFPPETHTILLRYAVQLEAEN